MVHSFYNGKKRLVRQSAKGCCHLFEEQLAEGNASLRLTSVQPSDKGIYKRIVTNEVETMQTDTELIVSGNLFSFTEIV